MPDLSFANQNIEKCTVKVSFDKFQAFLIGVLRPVDGRVENFLSYSDEVSHIIVSFKQKYFLLGVKNEN